MKACVCSDNRVVRNAYLKSADAIMAEIKLPQSGAIFEPFYALQPVALD